MDLQMEYSLHLLSGHLLMRLHVSLNCNNSVVLKMDKFIVLSCKPMLFHCIIKYSVAEGTIYIKKTL